MRLAPHTIDSDGTLPDQPRPRAVSPWELVLALPVLSLTALVLVQFGLLLAAGEAIRTAAEAGAREAALPKATWRSVALAVDRQLSASRLAPDVDPPMIEINGRPAGAMLDLRPGDEVAVTVSIDSLWAAPDLLRAIGLSLEGQKLRSRFAVERP